MSVLDTVTNNYHAHELCMSVKIFSSRWIHINYKNESHWVSG